METKRRSYSLLDASSIFFNNETGGMVRGMQSGNERQHSCSMERILVVETVNILGFILHFACLNLDF